MEWPGDRNCVAIRCKQRAVQFALAPRVERLVGYPPAMIRFVIGRNLIEVDVG